MESRYGIGINNRYALFLDEEGEENEDALVNKAKARAKEKGAKAAAAAAATESTTNHSKPGAPASSAPSSAAPTSAESGGNRSGGRGGKKVQEKNERNREGKIQERDHQSNTYYISPKR